MLHTALYRKWCPVSFEGVKSQGPIVQTLKNQITSERIGHTYLFCGTRGMGKTSIAKIFTRAVNCEHSVNGNPCNECLTRRSVQSDSSMNVAEVDAASNNGVESIRDIREQVQYPPIEGRYRVYIIDEVHMLSTRAFSALSKILEEPPFYVIFILATTEVHKVPITILSCCQRYDFKCISLETIADLLRELTQAEQMQVEDKALLYVVEAADGSLRDALNLLDQCVVFHHGRALTYDNVLRVLGVVDFSVFSQMFGAIVEDKTGDYMRSLEEIMIQGRELGQFITDSIWYTRSLLLIRSTDDAEGLMDMSEENLKQLESDAGGADGTTLMRYIRILSELFNQLRCASQKQVLVEVALIKLIHPSMESNLDAILQRLGDLETQMRDLEAGRMATPMTAAYHAAGSPSAGQVPQVGVGPGQDGGTAPQTAAPYAPGFQVEPGVMPEKVVLPRAQLENLKLVRNEWAKIARSMGGGVKSYLRDIAVEPGREGCLTIVLMGPMNYDMGRWPIVIGELERYVEVNFSGPIYFKTRLVDRGKHLSTTYVTQEELEEKIHMDIICKDE